jgi:hypothetical protein
MYTTTNNNGDSLAKESDICLAKESNRQEGQKILY